jgi:hypothetical protein
VTPRSARGSAWLLAGATAVLPAASPADDGGPHRCLARWQGPAEGCDLREVVSAEGLGASERKAARQASRNLERAAEAQRYARAAALPTGAREQLIATTGECAALAGASLAVTCFPEAHLSEDRYCSLELGADPCDLSQGFLVQGKAWSAGEGSRERICGEPGEEFLQLPPGEAACRAACWSQGRLRCGSAE